MPEPVSFPRQSARTQQFTLGEPRSISVHGDGRRVLFLRALTGSDPHTALWGLDLRDATERLVVDPTNLGAEEGLPAEERARRERARESATGVVSYASDDAGRVVAFALAGELWVADVDTGEVLFVPTGGSVFDPRPDPSGRLIAYVAGAQLRVVAAEGGGDRTLVAEDSPTVSWGSAEFVAAEEMGRMRGFWWAPDGSALLVQRTDDSQVPVWWIADPARPERAPVSVDYPAAGTANADVSLHVVPLAGSSTEVAWDRDHYPYLARVNWTEGRPPLVAVQSRDQRSVQMLAVDLDDGSTRVLYDDRDDVWVELFSGVPAWYGDRVVRIADRQGERRLFVGDDGVTPAGTYVRAVVAVDDDGVVFTASRGDPTQVHVFRWSDGRVERLTDEPGVHGAAAGGGTVVISSAAMDRFGQRHVVTSAAGRVTLRSCAETPVLTPSVRMLALGPRRLRAGLLLPREHRAGNKLPVLMDPYGGPHSQRVLMSRALWLTPQWFADQGFAVLVVDGRGTPGRDGAWERQVRFDLADGVLADQVEALHAAAEAEPDIDLDRVGIRGWSFGGYLAALAVLRRPDVFHAAVAGAPVTDWALYDTHYTERYLGDPAEQAEVYQRNSLLDQAASLTRPLLLIHGLADDNVVAAHTLRLSQRLTEAGRQHAVLPLTGVTHMTPQEVVAENLLVVQVAFLRSALGLRG